MPFRKRGRRRGGFRRARSFVRKTVVNMGTIHAKRVLWEGGIIPDITATPYDNPVSIDLLQCIETQAEEQISDGTVVADAPLYSKLVGVKLNLLVKGAVNDTTPMRWILYKSPDADITAATAMSNWHNSDDTSPAREMRANTLAKGMFITHASTGVTRVPIFIRRSTLKRLGKLKENDVIRFSIAAANAVTTQCTTYMWGTLYVKTAP